MANASKQWEFLAARDGAMSIFHFGKAFEKISECVGISPTLSALIDRDKIREARRGLRTLFPKFESVRHAVAHSAEMMHDMDEHMVRGPSIEHGIGEGANVFMSAVFKGREFINTIEGKFASYELSQASLDGLISVKSTMFSAFRAAEKELGERANLADPSQEKASGQSS